MPVAKPITCQHYRSNHEKEHELSCTRNSNCFLCLMKESNPTKRKADLSRFFKHLPFDPNDHSISITAIRSAAMARPNDPDLVELGVLECMASLICKGLQNRRWLLKDQNIFIPYYAAHIIGSYTIHRGDFAEKAVEGGVIMPLLELLRGSLTWVEQRVAVRALGHIASFESTFPSIAAHGELLELTMELAVSSLEIVYTQFIQSEDRRLRYHVELLTRGMKTGLQEESRRCEEWASQLQCWSLQLINCFAVKEEYLPTICKPGFLSKLPSMWGGLMNENSPAGTGLLLTICRHKLGRRWVAGCPSVIQALCSTARSSDDWQYMAVDCLLHLLQDPDTRRRIFDDAAVPLVDLAVQPCLGERKKAGRLIVETLLQQDTESLKRNRISDRTRHLVDGLASQRQRLKWEKAMSKDDLRVKQQAAHVVKLEGNAKFSAGDVIGAVYKYSEALSLCPLRVTKERVVLHSNRAQCHLLLQDPEAAISDATRALCLFKPLNGHGRSLWRRAQAYEMLGMSKESLLDALMFINECSNSGSGCAVPDYAERFVKKEMRATWIFLEAARKHGDMQVQEDDLQNKDDDEEEEDEEAGDDSEWETVSESDMTIVDETTDQGSCSKDEGESDYQLDKGTSDYNLQKLRTSFKGMELRQSFAGEDAFSEVTENKVAKSLSLDKELLKKRIYNLIKERQLLNEKREPKSPLVKGF